jgi:hypothetical protein
MEREMASAMNSVRRHAILTAISLVVGTLLVWWVEPNTAAGVTFLVAGSVAIINGLGAAATWRPHKNRTKIWIGWMAASMLLLSQTACDNASMSEDELEIQIEMNNAYSQCMYAKGNPIAGYAPMGGIAGPGKDAGALAADQEACKRFAHEGVATQAERANQRAVGAAAIGTVLGAGLGSASGAVAGAAIGAGTAVLGSHTPLRPARAFLSASNIPPADVGAYGVVAFRTLPTPANHDRLMMVCRAFLASLPAQESLPASVSLNDQMITVWPLGPNDLPWYDALYEDYYQKLWSDSHTLRKF